MYLSQLKEEYPLIYDRVVAQSSLSEDSLNDRNRDVNNALIWRDTTEGSEFWSAVYHKKWDLAKKLEPSLFSEIEIEEGNVKVTINGLFK